VTGFVVEVSAAAERVALPHRCPDGADAPVEVSVGPGARQRLADGEAFPATGRCRRCGGRAFGSLVDPDARAARRAAARPDPSALRRPTLPPNVRRFPRRHRAHHRRPRRRPLSPRQPTRLSRRPPPRTHAACSCPCRRPARG